LDDHTTNDFDGGGGGRSSGACDPSLLVSRTGSDLSTGAGRSVGGEMPLSALGAASFCAGESKDP
jgi:hypothetical protein